MKIDKSLNNSSVSLVDLSFKQPPREKPPTKPPQKTTSYVCFYLVGRWSFTRFSPGFLHPFFSPRKLKSFVMEWMTWLQFPVKSLAGVRSVRSTHTPKTNGWTCRLICMSWWVFDFGFGCYWPRSSWSGEWRVIFWSNIFKYLCNERQTKISHCQIVNSRAWRHDPFCS